MDLNNLGYTDEPFVLAKDVNQVFYVKDMSTKPKKGKNNDNELLLNVCPLVMIEP